MAESEWYYSQNGQQQGPVTLQALQDLAKSGQVKASDLAWKPGMANWVPSSQIPELAGLQGGYAPAPGLAAYPQPQQYAQPQQQHPQPQQYAQPQSGYAPQPPVYGQPQQFGNQPQQYAAPAYGQPVTYQPPGAYAVQPDSSGKATTAFVLSLCGIFCGILSIISLVLASQAKTSMRASNNYNGQGMATAAQVISGIFLGLWALGIIASLANH